MLNAPFDDDFISKGSDKEFVEGVSAPSGDGSSPHFSQVDAWLRANLPKFQAELDEGASTFFIEPDFKGVARFDDQRLISRTPYYWTCGDVQEAVRILFKPRQRESLIQRGWSAYFYTPRDFKPVSISVKSVVEQVLGAVSALERGLIVEPAFATRVPSESEWGGLKLQ